MRLLSCQWPSTNNNSLIASPTPRTHGIDPAADLSDQAIISPLLAFTCQRIRHVATDGWPEPLDLRPSPKTNRPEGAAARQKKLDGSERRRLLVYQLAGLLVPTSIGFGFARFFCSFFISFSFPAFFSFLLEMEKPKVLVGLLRAGCENKKLNKKFKNSPQNKKNTSLESKKPKNQKKNGRSHSRCN